MNFTTQSSSDGASGFGQEHTVHLTFPCRLSPSQRFAYYTIELSALPLAVQSQMES